MAVFYFQGPKSVLVIYYCVASKHSSWRWQMLKCLRVRNRSGIASCVWLRLSHFVVVTSLAGVAAIWILGWDWKMMCLLADFSSSLHGLLVTCRLAFNRKSLMRERERVTKPESATSCKTSFQKWHDITSAILDNSEYNMEMSTKETTWGEDHWELSDKSANCWHLRLQVSHCSRPTVVSLVCSKLVSNPLLISKGWATSSYEYCVYDLNVIIQFLNRTISCFLYLRGGQQCSLRNWRRKGA